MTADKNETYVCPPKCGSSKLPDEILASELAAIRKRRKNVPCKSATDCDSAKIRDNLVGLALSGGGIRSATFSLGVMQKLAKAGWLKQVDYLSTVSGGGYIGGSLTWLINTCKAFGTTCGNFPYGVMDPGKERQPSKQSKILRHLRLHGKYLIPGNGITVTSLIAVILRGILLNFVVWLPLLVALMVALMSLLHAICVPGSAHHVICLWNSTSSGCEFVSNSIWSVIQDFCLACNIKCVSTLDFLLCLAGFFGFTFLILSITFSLFTWKPIPDKFKIPKLLNDSYFRRRFFEKWIRWPLWIGTGFFVVGSLPEVADWLKLPSSNGMANAATLVLGLFGGLWSFYRSGHKGKIPLGVLAPLASLLLLYGLLWASYELAMVYFKRPWFEPVLFVEVGISILTGYFVNLNYISIHRYYRDRLMEAFMPDPDKISEPERGETSGVAEAADKANLSDMCSERAPYHLLNTNVVLVDSSRPRFRKRGGDAFLLSPKYCGSTATGWVKTASYMKKDPLTLATAVAISGAAANPNTAAGGSGPTRKPLLSLLMALLNVRLGYWVPHPSTYKHKLRKVANHFRAAFHELSSCGYAEHRKLLQISDGGHFENLGVYELVRRRVKLIICCDGSADPEFRFADLQVLARRIGTDFGAKIEFDCQNQLERLIPRLPVPQRVIDPDSCTDAYPVGAKFAERGYIKGTITYPHDCKNTSVDDESNAGRNKDSCTCEERDTCTCNCANKSTFILIKSTMITNLDIRLKGYKGANPDFPDQSTADQFFDEEQFEAYRELGYEIATRLVCKEKNGIKGLLHG